MSRFNIDSYVYIYYKYDSSSHLIKCYYPTMWGGSQSRNPQIIPVIRQCFSIETYGLQNLNGHTILHFPKIPHFYPEAYLVGGIPTPLKNMSQLG